MRDYGKVQTTFWTSQDTSGLTDTGRMLALYLLTSPHSNILGCFHLPVGYVCEDLKWATERVEKGFAELFGKGFATRDNDSKWVVMHAYLKWNPIENPNQGVSAGRLFEQIPSRSTVKPLLAAALREFSKHFPAKILDEFETVSKPLPKPFRNQEQEQEQEQDQEHATASCTKPQSASAPAASGLVDLSDMDALDEALTGGMLAAPPTPSPAPAPEPAEPPVLMMPLVGEAEFGITQSAIDGWVAAYPGVDVIRQLAAMRQWCIANPRKRKTKRGLLAFCNSWLMKEQDKAGARLPSASGGRPARFDPVAHVNQSSASPARGGDGIIDINPR